MIISQLCVGCKLEEIEAAFDSYNKSSETCLCTPFTFALCVMINRKNTTLQQQHVYPCYVIHQRLKCKL